MAATRRVERDLVSWFDEEISNLKDHLADGRCLDYPEYRFVCGTIQGLRMAQAEWAASIGSEDEEE